MFKFLSSLFKTEEIIPVGEIHGKQSFDKEGTSKDFYSRFKRHFTRKQLDEINAAYFRKYPSGKYNDLIWSLYNQLTLDYAKVNDLQELSQTYFEMANFLNKQDRDSFRIYQMAVKFQLKAAKAMDIPLKARISSCDNACKVCVEQNNRVFTIDEALKIMPIPHPNCENVNGSHSLCRCSYDLITEDDPNW